MMKPLKKIVEVNLLLIAFIFIFHLQSKAQCHEDDWTALKALYEFAWGDDWTDNTNWHMVTDSVRSTNCNLDSLYGVELNTNGRVVYLNLSNNNLRGSVQAEIGLLTELKYLNLSNNNLSWGEIPEEIDSLTSLEYLNLSECSIKNFIPSELGNLINLKELLLNNNELGRGIPSELGKLSNLKVLDLSMNLLKGSIPAELGNLNSLEYLYLKHNQLTGKLPVALSYLSNLKELVLLNNEFYGSIPLEFGNLSNLIELTLSNNSFSGNIPISVTNIPKLQYLVLADNAFAGEIPPEIGNLSNLIQLSLGGNLLSGSIPIELGYLENLKFLWLYSNQLSGNIPSELTSLSNLVYLVLWGNELSGNIPTELGSLCKLEVLFLDKNNFSGSIPKELGKLQELVFLDLSLNELSGSIPSELGNLRELEFLSLSNNKLSGHIPQDLGYISGLYDLYLNNNQLEGNLPAELGNLTHLDVLKVTNNKLSGCFNGKLQSLCGRIWSNWGDYSWYIDDGNNFNVSFEEFCIDRTGICTTCIERDSLVLIELYEVANGKDWVIPWDIENEPVKNWHGLNFDDSGCVKDINLSNMNINAKLTDILEPLTNLSLNTLDLSNNQISGYIPPQIEDFNNIKSLKLDHNQLIGKIPYQLSNKLRFLDTLKLNNNQLSGCYYSSIDIFCSHLFGFTNEDISEGNQFDEEWEAFCESRIDEKGQCENLLYFEIDKIDVTEDNSVEFYIYVSVPYDLLYTLNFSIQTNSDCDSFNVEIINPYLTEDGINISSEIAGRLDVVVNHIHTEIEFNDYHLIKIKTCPFALTTENAKFDITGNIEDRNLSIPLYQNDKNLSATFQLNERTACDYSASISIIGKSKIPFSYLSINNGDTIIDSISNFHEISINDLKAEESYDISVKDADGKVFSTTLIIPGKASDCKLDTISNPPEMVDTMTMVVDTTTTVVDTTTTVVDTTTMEVDTMTLINVSDIELDDPFTFELYPNPADDIIQVKLHNPKKVNKYKIHIFDVAGKIVEDYNWIGQNASQSLDISNIGSGIYFLELKNDDYSLMKKLFKR